MSDTTKQVGDIVWFKADIEQQGRITEIIRDPYGGRTRYRLEPVGRDAFSGDYIGGQTTHVESADRTF